MSGDQVVGVIVLALMAATFFVAIPMAVIADARAEKAARAQRDAFTKWLVTSVCEAAYPIKTAANPDSAAGTSGEAVSG